MTKNNDKIHAKIKETTLTIPFLFLIHLFTTIKIMITFEKMMKVLAYKCNSYTSSSLSSWLTIAINRIVPNVQKQIQ